MADNECVQEVVKNNELKNEKSPPTFFPKLNYQSNCFKRVLFGSLFASLILLLIYLGPVAIILGILIIQIFCFNEVITIAYNYNKIPGLPSFHPLCWYFLIAANYFFYGETLGIYFEFFIKKWHYLQILTIYHRFISFCFYLLGIIWFVLSLVCQYDLKQFRILAWTHTALMIIVLQSYMVMQNLFQGIIWFLLPVSLVIINDIGAYCFGRTIGKTPLIKLSPNKTWEGFIGGGICTLIFGFLLTYVMCNYQYFICPVKYSETINGIELNTNCTPNYIFEPTDYHLISSIIIKFYPFMLHAFAFALFASIIAPFGGFFASGFKRAFKIKDFGDVIPGHGGMMDRCDCQFLMATFVNVYIYSFINNSPVDNLFNKILELPEDQQLEIYYILEGIVGGRG